MTSIKTNTVSEYIHNNNKQNNVSNVQLESQKEQCLSTISDNDNDIENNNNDNNHVDNDIPIFSWEYNHHDAN